MSAIGMPKGKDFVISGYADYRRDSLVFARMQSQHLRDMEWEGRIKPLCSWSALLGRTAIVVAFAGAIAAFFI